MLEEKIFINGGLNSDTDIHALPSNDYLDALNVRSGSSDGQNKGAITNVKGNTAISFTLPEGTNKNIGKYEDEPGNRLFYFNYNSAGNHGIYVWDKTANTTTKLIEDLTDTADVAVLNFSTDFLINHANLINNQFLLWTDGSNPPRNLDVERALAAGYGVFTNQSIDAIKYPPEYCPISLATLDDGSMTVNFIKDALYQFKYRYVYFDNSRSVFSPVSKVDILNSRCSPIVNLYQPEWKDSIVQFNYSSGNALVKAVEIAVRVNNTGDWALYDYIDLVGGAFYERAVVRVRVVANGSSTTYMVTLAWDAFSEPISISTTTDPATALGLLKSAMESNTNINNAFNISVTELANNDAYMVIISKDANLPFAFVVNSNLYGVVTDLIQEQNETNTYTFRNNKAFIPILESEVNQPFDYVPLKAATQEIVAQNNVVYGNYLEGYDNIEVNALVTATNIPVSLAQTLSIAVSGPSPNTYTFTGTVQVGDLVQLTGRAVSNDQFAQVSSTATTDVLGDLLNDLVLNFNINYSPLMVASVAGNIISISNGGSPTALFIAKGGIAYNVLKAGDTFQYGIVYYDTAGRFGSVQTSPTMAVDVPWRHSDSYYEPTITINNIPPIWADRYAILRSVRQKTGNYLDFVVRDVAYEPTRGIAQIAVQGSIATYNDQNDTNVAYSFSEGDRIRFIKDQNGVYFDGYNDFKILGLTEEGAFEITDPQIEFEKGSLIELYSPRTAQSEIYFEIAAIGQVVDAGTADRVHASPLNSTGTAQTSSTPLVATIHDGDVWMRQRRMIVEGGGYFLGWCEDDRYGDTGNTLANNIGRPNVVNPNSKQERYPATMRFSGSLIGNTTVNNINRFQEDSFFDYDINYGSIQKLATRDKVLITYQQLKIGKVPIYGKIIYNADQSESLILSESLLNEIVYYQGDFGIGNHPESFARWQGNLYNVDANRGVVVRLAFDGLNPISTLFNMNTYFTDILGLFVNSGNIFGGFDPKFSEYLVSFEGEYNDTIGFNERSNKFTSRYSYLPDYMAYLGTELLSFKEGILYRHNTNSVYNNFYGVQYSSFVRASFNQDPLTVKQFQAVTETASNAWICDVDGDIETSLGQLSNLVAADFQIDGIFTSKEGTFVAGLLNDSLSPGGIINGDSLRGKYIILKLKNSSVDLVTLFSVGVKFAISPQTRV